MPPSTQGPSELKKKQRPKFIACQLEETLIARQLEGDLIARQLAPKVNCTST